MRIFLRAVSVVTLVSLFVACGGGSDGKSRKGQVQIPDPPVVTVDAGQKQLIFSWAVVPNVTHYRLLENPDGHSGFTQAGENVPAGKLSATKHIAVHRHDWVNALYAVQACNSAGCAGSTEVSVNDLMLDTIVYVKGSNVDFIRRFGESISLSGDTLAVGAPRELGGAVYVFIRNSDGNWAQQAHLQSYNQDWDYFGQSVALSDDTLVVGAPQESSAATGINGDQDNNDAIRSGAVFVYTRDINGEWSQQAYIKASNTAAEKEFGAQLALSGDTLAATGASNVINHTVDVFTRDGAGTWAQQAQITTDNRLMGGRGPLALSGGTLAIGSMALDLSKSVYVYTRDGDGAWSQQAEIPAPFFGDPTLHGVQFGWSVALSGDTLAVGDPAESGAATGVDGDPRDMGARKSGAAYVFTRDTTGTWSQDAYIKASNTGGVEPPIGLPPGVGHVGDEFGSAVTVLGDRLAVGALYEDSAARGINGDQFDDIVPGGFGAVYTFVRDNAGTWSQEAYVKASNAGRGDAFGMTVVLSEEMLVVGAPLEDSAGRGINDDQENNLRPQGGAVYVY